MGHKKFGVRLGLSLLAVAIVIPLASRVNHLANDSKERTKSKSLRIEGAPFLSLPTVEKALVADGPPVPPVPPPKEIGSATELLIADGPPVPPVPPPKWMGEVSGAIFG